MSIAAPHSAVTTTSQVQSSELSRNSAEVFRAAERGPVLVTRRDAEPLVLTSKTAADEPDQVLAAAALIGAFGLCGRDYSSARACFTMKQSNLFLGTVNGWRGTAEAYAAGLLNVPNDWLDRDVEVNDPRAS